MSKDIRVRRTKIIVSAVKNYGVIIEIVLVLQSVLERIRAVVIGTQV
jgi:hypothetical protein